MKAIIKQIVESPVFFNVAIAMAMLAITSIATLFISFFNIDFAVAFFLFGFLSSMGTGAAGLAIADYD